ncbi:hypothetical protein VP01_280g2 [Puccinia sorghi]|uniref:Uncharacterized protein n=1 Tax=Puccinia sorghi TaxID=27349 RepID=A0A0L6V2G0_9BASI|nr:hypothetical protein VP01_280g2 [Puccinia sorghi]
MAPRPRLTLLDYGHRAIVTSKLFPLVRPLPYMVSGYLGVSLEGTKAAIWQIHKANIAAGAEYMRVLKIVACLSKRRPARKAATPPIASTSPPRSTPITSPSPPIDPQLNSYP